MTEPQGSAQPVGVVVSVDPDRFAEVVAALRRAGLTVTGEQPLLGALTGTVPDEDRIPALAALDGVDAVDREVTYRAEES
ncbi:hypothetical protein ACFY0P_15150 [Streptomyces sp. NPDC001714]|uniref:hypothetical protein n=1 Tax=Streptomyces sp. NPDC001714 TaxID=3364603 RepID=UPI0036A22477